MNIRLANDEKINQDFSLLNVVLLTHCILIGFSHPKARYFLLSRQKQVSKEKATQLPLHPCAPRFWRGVVSARPNLKMNSNLELFGV